MKFGKKSVPPISRGDANHVLNVVINIKLLSHVEI